MPRPASTADLLQGVKFGATLANVTALRGAWATYSTLTCGGASGAPSIFLGRIAVYPVAKHASAANFTVIPIVVDGGCTVSAVSCATGNACSIGARPRFDV